MEAAAARVRRTLVSSTIERAIESTPARITKVPPSLTCLKTSSFVRTVVRQPNSAAAALKTPSSSLCSLSVSSRNATITGRSPAVSSATWYSTGGMIS